MTQLHSERSHSKWSASSSSRWMACPASVELIEKAPPQKSSPYAAEGTCAHELAEKALLGSGNCMDYVGETFEGYEVTEEMANYVQHYVNYISNIMRKNPSNSLLIEEKFNLDFIREGLYGSNDACILEPFGTLEIIDLKYGKGIEVEAKDNKQLMYYALGAAYGQDFEKIKLTIIQPRIQQSTKSHTITMKELEQFAEELGKAVDATKEENPTISAGSHCFFCPAKGICPEQRKAVQKTTLMDFEADTVKTEKSLPSPDTMKESVLANVLDHSDTIKKWLDSVKSYAVARLEAGEPIKGYKLVHGRANRKVRSETELKMAFGEDIYEKKLLGIGKLEKKFGKSEVADFLYKPEPPVTLAKSNDKRPSIKREKINMAEEFGLEETSSNKDNNFDNFDF